MSDEEIRGKLIPVDVSDEQIQRDADHGLELIELSLARHAAFEQYLRERGEAA